MAVDGVKIVKMIAAGVITLAGVAGVKYSVDKAMDAGAEELKEAYDEVFPEKTIKVKEEGKIFRTKITKREFSSDGLKSYTKHVIFDDDDIDEKPTKSRH